MHGPRLWRWGVHDASHEAWSALAYDAASFKIACSRLIPMWHGAQAGGRRKRIHTTERAKMRDERALAGASVTGMRDDLLSEQRAGDQSAKCLVWGWVGEARDNPKVPDSRDVGLSAD